MEDYVIGKGPRDYKTMLQELASQELRSMPEYRLEERGPDHEKEFTATVYLTGEPFGTGTGRSKKEAEQQAAREALRAHLRTPHASGLVRGSRWSYRRSR
jgi:ribonuclease-3